MAFFRFPFPNGILEVFHSHERTVLDFTPSEGPSLYSILEGKVLKKDDLLKGFFVEIEPFGEAFLPFSSAEGIKVGDRTLFQISREGLEGKPPRVSTKFFIPFCGCDIVFDGRGRVSFFGKPSRFKELKETAKRLRISLKVLDGEKCLQNLPKVERFLKLLKEGRIKLLWEGIYTLLLRSCGGEVLVPERELCEKLNILGELFGIETLCRVESLRKLLLRFSFSRLAGLLFKDRIDFDGGFFLLGGAGNITVVDVNGYGSAEFINRKAVELLERLKLVGRLEGRILVDFVGLFKDKNLKEFVKERFSPLGCSLLGYTNGGLLEVVCPVLRESIFDRLSVFSEVCRKRVKSDRFLLYEVLERLYTFKGESAILKLHPSREGLKGEVEKLYEGKVKVFPDPTVAIDNFEILPD